MKLSTRGRYGTRMMLDLGLHRDEGPVQIGEIARRLSISVKYLEQLIIPLKKADFITSVRGPKGGHMLAVSPEDVTVGDIVISAQWVFYPVQCHGTVTTSQRNKIGAGDR